MFNTKFKGAAKFKTYGKCELSRKNLCDDAMVSNETKVNYRDYMNEIFAGLIWLG